MLVRLISLTLCAALAAPSAASAADGWLWPVRGPVITQYRNGTDPYAAGQHRGIDIAAPVGTEVVAAAAGVVTFAGTAGSSGLTVAIRTADGSFDTSYLHLSRIDVRKGDRLAAGDAVGAVGLTGRRSADEPHLHFGVRVAGSDHDYRDPLSLLPPPPAATGPRAPLPAPAGAPAAAPPAAPVPAPVGAPRRAPAPRPVRHPRPVRAPRPHRAGPRPLPTPVPVVRAARRGAALRRPAPARPAPASAPAGLAPGIGPAGRSYGPAPDAPRTAPHAGGASRHGADLGLLAACVGMVALAACLGRPGRARRAAARGRSLGAWISAWAAAGESRLGARQ
ncbi:MAG: M23 family metallopeptidase [Thermoleophilaceae bacterium]|nr:M23 family metallopeptidase [Thermoleophilaceae bacterium]